MCATPDGQVFGTAVEINFDYRDPYKKIMHDFIKLVDSRDCYLQRVYVAVGRNTGFRELVMNGLECADINFMLPRDLYVLVAELSSHSLWEAITTTECAPEVLSWTTVAFPKKCN
jgi:hypothetical protein